MSQARGLQRRPLVSRSIPGLKLKPKTGSIAQSVGKSTLQNTKAKMKPGKERPASSCFSIQGLRSGASPKKWAKSKTLGAQGMLRRPRALLVPISSEPVRRIGLGSSSGHDPKRTLSPYHTRGTRRPAIQLKVKTILNGPKPFRCLLDSFKSSQKGAIFHSLPFRSFRLILGLENTLSDVSVFAEDFVRRALVEPPLGRRVNCRNILVGVEKLRFPQNIENLEDRKSLGKSRTSFVEHPRAILFW